jgi:hypothetical protein
MVVILPLVAASTGKEQERIGLPSRCTVQAPQEATPHPNLVPVKFNSSLITHSSGVSVYFMSLPLPAFLIVNPDFTQSELEKYSIVD